MNIISIHNLFLMCCPTKHPTACAGIFLSIGLGIFMLFSGIGKLQGGLDIFATKMAGGFIESILPVIIAKIFLYAVPFIEILLGVWLISTWKRRISLFALGIFLLILILGHSLKGDMGVDKLFLYLLITSVGICLPGCCKCESKD